MIWRVLATLFGLAFVGLAAAWHDAVQELQTQRELTALAMERVHVLGESLAASIIEDADTLAALQASNQRLAVCVARQLAIEGTRR